MRSFLLQRKINLLTNISNITSTMVENLSSVVGATVTDALDTLLNAITGLDTSDITNASGVTGATTTDALNTLNTGLGNISTDDVSNASTVPGATASDALDNLLTDLGALTSSDISNNSNFAGATVTDALNTAQDDIALLSGQLSVVSSRANVEWVSAYMSNINATDPIYIPAPFESDLIEIKVCVFVNPGASNTFNPTINGNPVTNGSIIVGAAEGGGIVKSSTPTGVNHVTATDSVRIASNAAATNDSPALFLLCFQYS